MCVALFTLSSCHKGPIVSPSEEEVSLEDIISKPLAETIKTNFHSSENKNTESQIIYSQQPPVFTSVNLEENKDVVVKDTLSVAELSNEGEKHENPSVPSPPVSITPLTAEQVLNSDFFLKTLKGSANNKLYGA